MNQIASILAFIIGIMSIVAGGKAMRGWDPGYSVIAWLPVYNFGMGILTLIPAILIWVNHRYAMITALDTEYQAAVKNNDAITMDRILADDFILVMGRGKVYDKTDLLDAAKNKDVIYEQNEDTQQTVRVWGDTAVITALLWQKGSNKGKPFDDHLWFSDTYVRNPNGWKYAFGQASIRLPD